MDKKQAWLQLVQEKSEHYLNLHDGGFDEKMRARLVSCDYENQTVTYAFPTQTWQINEKGGDYGMEVYLSVYIVKAGRSLIRQRAELTDAATGKLLATASGSWMPL